MTGKIQQPIDLAFLRSRPTQKRVAAVTILFAVAGGLYGFLAPRWYRSVLSVVPASSPKPSGLASLAGMDPGGLAAGLGVSLGGGADVARIAAVLQSVTVTDAVIDKFDLKKRYGERYQETAREELWTHCDVRTLPKPNLVQLSCEDKDPEFVPVLLGYFAQIGNQAFRRVGVSSASEEVRFLEKRGVELRQQADRAAVEVRTFQEKHQIVDLDSQAKAVVASVATLNAERISRQMQLEYARTFSSADEAGTRQIESQLSVVDDKLRDLEYSPEQARPDAVPGGVKTRKGPGMFPAALAVPQLRSEYERLYRDRKVAETTLVLALDRLEGAKAAEARDVSTFVVLDSPPLPTRKTRPRILVSLLVGAGLGLGASVAFSWWVARKGKTEVAAR